VVGRHQGLEFVTGYLLEEALSVDNLFVFILLFAYFKFRLKKKRPSYSGELLAH